MPQLRPIQTPPHAAGMPLSPDHAGSAGFTPAETQAMQRAILQLAQRWELTDQELSTLLGNLSTRTLQRWKNGEYGRVGVDTAARMSNLLGIHKALRLLFKEASRGYGWIKRKNAAFEDHTALEVMLGGQLTDLMRVRRYLDSMRAPW